MIPFLIGLAVFLLVLFGSRYFAYADTSTLARNIRRFSGVLLFIIGALLLLPGLLVIAIPLGLFGLSFLRRNGGIRFGGPFGGLGFGQGLGGAGAQRRAGQRSFVRTAHLEMTLDHDTGRVDGGCIAGRFAGRALASLSVPELRMLLGELRGDPQEAALLQAYLNQRAPGWQGGQTGPGAQGRAGPNGRAGSQGWGGQGRAGPGGRRAASSGRMSVDEAYDVLGLRRGATKDDIRHAHRQLMKKVHPDQGGSTYLAARINEAKEVLMAVL